MKDYTSLLGSVQNPGDLYLVSSFNLSAFIPNSVISWYSYHGSLSAPPCSENVRWVVIAEPQPINTQIVIIYFVDANCFILYNIVKDFFYFR